MDKALYALENAHTLETPALVYYKDIIEENTRRAINRAGGPERFWPHVKSHKMADLIRMQQGMGVQRFKCATIAEGQMVAECGAEHIVLAYPLVGPNIERFLTLQARYQASAFYAIGDDLGQLTLLSAQSKAHGVTTRVLLDINMGMNRTGVDLDRAGELYKVAAGLENLQLAGLHCYDGHIHHPDIDERTLEAHDSLTRAHALRDRLRQEGYRCDFLIMGGTPTFPVHAAYEDVYLSPGTVFLGDAKCLRNVAELNIVPAAGIWTRVVSHPAPGMFTLDLGSKGISTDQPDGRGMVLGLDHAKPLFQSEEHWVWQMDEGEDVPAIGQMFFVIPLHVCPATALYPFAHVASGGSVVGRWDVTARNRNIGI